ncbi:MAG: phospholipid carrier-dependent glycosyltransferase [Acidobacteria bacterium]|nr:phospholipid carrier-dependent glycosyltransferase [Acidobacteriota bacterium]
MYKKLSSLQNLFTDENWYRLLLIFIAIFSTCLRFWGLARFDVLVFDEVHFANFAQSYLTNTHVFDAHPPLGKYFIAFGIWALGFNPVGYRWVNALVGSFIPIILIALAYRLTGNKRYALLSGFFASLDGLLLVEARLALLNTYLIFFGLLGHLFFLITLCKRGWKQWFFLTLTGIFLGATVAVKWSGLSIIIAIYATWLTIYILKKLFPENFIFTKDYSEKANFISPLEQIEQIKIYHLLYLPLIIYSIYILSWQPHLRQNPGTIKEIETQIYTFHKSFANKPEEHPYTSPWFTWPIMARPVSYFYETVKNPDEIVPTGKKPIPLNEAALVYDIHAMGNPLLYLLALVSLLWIIFTLVERFSLIAIELVFQQNPNNKKYLLAINFFVPLYLIISYSANLFSWAGVSRFTFLYHYIPASTFSFLTAAWVLEHCLVSSKQKSTKNLAIIIISIIFLGFLFFLPIYLGLPLSPRGFFLRMWLPSWI